MPQQVGGLSTQGEQQLVSSSLLVVHNEKGFQQVYYHRRLSPRHRVSQLMLRLIHLILASGA